MIKKKVALFNERMIKGHGVDVVVDHIARALSGKGYEVTVYVLFTDGTYDNNLYHIEVLGELKRSFISRVIGRFVSSMAANDIDMWFSREKVSTIDADICIINSYPFFPLLRYFKMPCIVVEYGVASNKYLSFKHKINSWYATISQHYIFFRGAKRILSISDFLKHRLLYALQNKTTTIYLGGDTYKNDNLELAKVKQFRSTYGILETDVAYLYVGRANTQSRSYKDIHELIELFTVARARDSKIKLIIVGFGNDEDERYLTQHSVIPILNAPASELSSIYPIADVYTSATKWEGFNLPLAEAQYFGKPVVVYDIGPHKELVIGGKTGFLVTNKEQFIDKVEALATDPVLRNTMSQAAREQGKNFTWQKTTDGFVKSINTVING